MGQYKNEQGKTRIGQFLQNIGDAGKPILQVAAGLTGQQWLNTVAQSITTSKDITIQQKEEVYNMYMLDMQDVANARTHNIEIQKSAESSWMSKNMPYIFDSFIIAVWGCLTAYIALKYIGLLELNKETNMDGLWGLYAAVTSAMTTIIAYHRGSSAGSKTKNNLFNTKNGTS